MTPGAIMSNLVEAIPIIFRWILLFPRTFFTFIVFPRRCYNNLYKAQDDASRQLSENYTNPYFCLLIVAAMWSFLYFVPLKAYDRMLTLVASSYPQFYPVHAAAWLSQRNEFVSILANQQDNLASYDFISRSGLGCIRTYNMAIYDGIYGDSARLPPDPGPRRIEREISQQRDWIEQILAQRDFSWFTAWVYLFIAPLILTFCLWLLHCRTMDAAMLDSVLKQTIMCYVVLYFFMFFMLYIESHASRLAQTTSFAFAQWHTLATMLEWLAYLLFFWLAWASFRCYFRSWLTGWVAGNLAIYAAWFLTLYIDNATPVGFMRLHHATIFILPDFEPGTADANLGESVFHAIPLITARPVPAKLLYPNQLEPRHTHGFPRLPELPVGNSLLPLPDQTAMESMSDED